MAIGLARAIPATGFIWQRTPCFPGATGNGKAEKAAPDVDLRRNLKWLDDRHYLQTDRCYLAMQDKLAGNDVEKCCQAAEISKESDHVELALRPDYAAKADNY